MEDGEHGLPGQIVPKDVEVDRGREEELVIVLVHLQMEEGCAREIKFNIKTATKDHVKHQYSNVSGCMVRTVRQYAVLPATSRWEHAEVATCHNVGYLRG